MGGATAGEGEGTGEEEEVNPPHPRSPPASELWLCPWAAVGVPGAMEAGERRTEQRQRHVNYLCKTVIN